MMHMVRKAFSNDRPNEALEASQISRVGDEMNKMKTSHKSNDTVAQRLSTILRHQVCCCFPVI